jgi:hypothetical protein
LDSGQSIRINLYTASGKVESIDAGSLGTVISYVGTRGIAVAKEYSNSTIRDLTHSEPVTRIQFVPTVNENYSSVSNNFTLYYVV